MLKSTYFALFGWLTNSKNAPWYLWLCMFAPFTARCLQSLADLGGASSGSRRVLCNSGMSNESNAFGRKGKSSTLALTFEGLADGLLSSVELNQKRSNLVGNTSWAHVPARPATPWQWWAHNEAGSIAVAYEIGQHEMKCTRRTSMAKNAKNAESCPNREQLHQF